MALVGNPGENGPVPSPATCLRPPISARLAFRSGCPPHEKLSHTGSTPAASSPIPVAVILVVAALPKPAEAPTTNLVACRFTVVNTM